MALTHCPDPPNLCDGPGTAAEQAARPRMYADYVNGGWTSGEEPPATAQVVAWPTAGLAWQFATELLADWDFGDGQSSPFPGELVQHDYATAGTYTATATDSEGKVGTVTVTVRADQGTGPPTLTSVTPQPVSIAAPATLTLTGTGFTPTSRVTFQAYNMDGLQVFIDGAATYVSATQLTAVFDATGLNVDWTLTVRAWVTRADNSATGVVNVTLAE